MRSVHLPISIIKIFLIPLMLFVGLIGVSYSLYKDRLNIDSVVAMGDIDVIFSDLYIKESSPGSYGSIDVNMADSGKNIEINITDAMPGYFSLICFEVINNGTVPVLYQLDGSGGDGFISVSADPGCIYPGGDTAQGQININVGDYSEYSEGCTLYLELIFQQATVVK